jgi:hypothetical protein
MRIKIVTGLVTSPAHTIHSQKLCNWQDTFPPTLAVAAQKQRPGEMKNTFTIVSVRIRYFFFKKKSGGSHRTPTTGKM